MALSDLDVKELYQGTGSGVTFPITFDYVTSAEVQVWLRDESGALVTESLLVAPTHYSVSAGNVVMVTTPAATQKLIIVRVNPLTQAMSYSNTGPFLASDHEKSMDKIMRVIQELNEKISRCIKVSVTSSPLFDGEMDPNMAGMIPMISSDGLGVTFVSTVPTVPEAIRSVSSSGAIATTDGMIIANASSGDMILTMFPAVGNSTKQITVKRSDNSGNSLTIIYTDLCDGMAYHSLDNQYQTLTMKSDGVTWWLK